MMDQGAVCIPNIGVKNRQMRRNFGLVMAAIGIIVGLVMLVAGAGFWVRVWLFVPFHLGAIGVFQACEKT
jgi:hypothetical protein